MYYTVIILFVTVLFICATLYQRHRSKYLKNMPGPKANVIFGNLPDFVGGSDKTLEKFLEYSNKFNSPFIVKDGTFSRIVVITDPEWNEFLLGSTKFIDKSLHYDYLINWLGNGLFTSSGPKWKTRRRILTPSFHFSILESSVDIFNSVGDVFISKLQKEVGKNSFDVLPPVSLCVLDVICEAAMNFSIDAQGNSDLEYVKSVKAICEIILDRVLSLLHPILYPLTPNYYKEKRLSKALHSHTDRIIEDRFKHPRSKKQETEKENDITNNKLAFLDSLLDAKIDGNPLSLLAIREEVDTFMFAGHDTISAAIGFTLYCLAMDPDVHKRTVEEQISIYGKSENARNTEVNYKDLHNMKYLEMVIKESLRLYPPAPGIFRKAPEDFVRDGVIYPKGQTFLIFGLHRSPKYYPDPEKFIPERWENAKLANPYMYIPFSAGPRNCLGQKFAMLEMKCLLSKIIRNFEIKPPSPKQELILAPEVVLVSKNGIHISLENRK